MGDSLPSILGVVGIGIVVFATTNIDDILLLSAFFADRALQTRSVIIGQFAGIGALTAASTVAALLALAIPEGWIGLLGLAPIALGLKGLFGLWRGTRDSSEPTNPSPSETPSRKQWVAVALLTMANGGDNLGVYIPLFSRDLAWIPVFVTIFAIMTALWCLAGYWLVNHQMVGVRVRQYGHVALPFVLVGLGLHILSDALILVQ